LDQTIDCLIQFYEVNLAKNKERKKERKKELKGKKKPKKITFLSQANFSPWV